MGFFRHGGNPAGGVARSRPVIGLLALILVLVLGLVWQSVRIMQFNRATATGVLQDYARLVADEFARRALAEIGYYGYYATINAMKQQIAAGSDGLATDGASASADTVVRPLADYRFVSASAPAALRFSAGSSPSADVQQYLQQRAEAFLGETPAESGFAVDHVLIADQPHTFVLARDPSGTVFGFEVDQAALSERLQQLFEREALLPKSLASGTIGNDSIYLRLADSNEQLLFQSQGRYDPYLVVQRPIGDEYEGVFRGHVVTAAIDVAVADALVIGGLPRSRLPLLLATVLLTVGLLLAAIRQLQREHALMKLRDDFVSGVSHELRTPLTQIRMFAETLLYDRFRANEDRTRAVQIINRESQRLIHLVENVLRFSGRNGGARELHLVLAPLAPEIERVAEEFRPLAEAAGNTLAVELRGTAAINTDTDALRQVLLNLLDNAVKYGPPEQQIRVILSEQPDSVSIRVCDQGPGIPLVEREKIWSGYVRLAREQQSAIGGTGIGLAVVRELVTQMGGSVSVTDGERGGACFVIEFPRAAAPT